MAAFRQPPPDSPQVASEREQDHAAFLTQHWMLVAATAWGGYQREGRGAVVIMGDGADPVPPGQPTMLGATPAYYVSDQHAAQWEAGWPHPEVQAKVETYDPTVQVVAVIVHRGIMSSYTMRRDELPSPPAAYGQINHAR